MVKKASDVSERALADDDLIPKRSHIEGRDLMFSKQSYLFLTIEIWGFTLKTRPGKGITAYAKTMLSRLIKFYVDLNNES
jgi:hypothetical protein